MSATRTAARSWVRARLLAAIAGVFMLVARFAASASTRAAANTNDSRRPTIVLLHGAFSDALSMSGVITRLQRDGYPVIAPANPLRSLSGDSAYIASVLAQTPGPLVVVGHSYGGAVCTNAAAGNENVKALVYIDAFIPDIGENIAQLTGAGSQVPGALESKTFPPFGPNDVDDYVKKDLYRTVLAADVPATTTAVLAAAQRPLAAPAFVQPTRAAAWKTIPSWALIGRQDRAIPPDMLRFMARRAHATTVEINSSHFPTVSHPDHVTELIETAATATE
jgi:pimeloyl-ACP methyl ester carboxylesterase